jgi:hypothetical protein
MRTVLTYTAVLVGAYLLASHLTGAGQLLTSAGGTYVAGVKALQGR